MIKTNWISDVERDGRMWDYVHAEEDWRLRNIECGCLVFRETTVFDILPTVEIAMKEVETLIAIRKRS